MKVWGFYKGEGLLPRKAEVAEALRHVGYEHVRLDRAARTVEFARPGVELDPGGIGKGYAVDRMVEVLKRQASASRSSQPAAAAFTDSEHPRMTPGAGRLPSARRQIPSGRPPKRG